MNKPIFSDLDAGDEEQEVSEIEGLCMNCHEQGMTRLLLTKIPHFREVIVSSFRCEECNYSDTDIQYGGKIQDKGIKYEVLIQNARDLDRQVVKSDSASFSIPSLQFEQPQGKKGEINTVEGLIDGIIRGLEQEQPIRRAMDPEVAAKIDAFIQKLQDLKVVKEPFKIVLEDPSGNSFVENPEAPKKDEGMTVSHYVRTAEQDRVIGLQLGEDADEADDSTNQSAEAVGGGANQEAADTDTGKEENLKHEVLSFPTNCPSCSSPCDTRMKLVDIPHFKQVIIMATNCDACGNRESEVKSGSGVEDLGTKITLHITDPSDLNRDVLKSDTCGVEIPELELELMEGTLGGRFTTVEGLLQQIKDELKTKNPFFMGDGAATDTKRHLEVFLGKLEQVIAGERLDVTFILNDPAGNSYLQNLYAPDPDPEMTVERYTRSSEQNDNLGLLQMKTENYSADS